eukprot:COSAG01_NODE_1_length_100484_cov_170.446142_106_plen_329_part_00
MKFIDLVHITAIGGHGGRGAVGFARKKFEPNGGPSGGDGGDGGSVILEVKGDLRSLLDLKFRPSYSAKNGEPGGNNKMHGLNGKDLVIYVPKGVIVKDSEEQLLADLCKEGERFIVAKGGRGGMGNAHFSRPTLQAPSYAQPGIPGDTISISLELQAIADCGIIGLPNAGKSTLLHTLTQAAPKIANYPFTTLSPNLGVLKFIDQHITMADIPGLIKGASQGLGLGHDFLRHISRTSSILHVIEANTDPKICFENYLLIQKELEASPCPILDKPQLIILSKIDVITDKERDEILAFFSKKGLKKIYCIAYNDKRRLAKLKQAIQKQHS